MSVCLCVPLCVCVFIYMHVCICVHVCLCFIPLRQGLSQDWKLWFSLSQQVTPIPLSLPPQPWVTGLCGHTWLLTRVLSFAAQLLLFEPECSYPQSHHPDLLTLFVCSISAELGVGWKCFIAGHRVSSSGAQLGETRFHFFSIFFSYLPKGEFIHQGWIWWSCSSDPRKTSSLDSLPGAVGLPQSFLGLSACSTRLPSCSGAREAADLNFGTLKESA